MTLITWMKRANTIKVQHDSNTKREKKKKRRAPSSERKENNSRLDKTQGLRLKARQCSRPKKGKCEF